jgi:hypothetical protein
MALLSDQHYRPELPDGYLVGGTDFGFRAQCKSRVVMDGWIEFLQRAVFSRRTVPDAFRMSQIQRNKEFCKTRLLEHVVHKIGFSRSAEASEVCVT